MTDFNFDATIDEIGNVYEGAKDNANRMFPLTPAEQQDHSKLMTYLQRMRDLGATAAQAAQNFQQQVIALNAAAVDAKLKPHPDYDFVDDDQLFIEAIEGRLFFLLHYEHKTADWNLIPYADVSFTDPVWDSEGRVVAEPLIAYGYEALQRVVDDYDAPLEAKDILNTAVIGTPNAIFRYLDRLDLEGIEYDLYENGGILSFKVKMEGNMPVLESILQDLNDYIIYSQKTLTNVVRTPGMVDLAALFHAHKEITGKEIFYNKHDFRFSFEPEGLE